MSLRWDELGKWEDWEPNAVAGPFPCPHRTKRQRQRCKRGRAGCIERDCYILCQIISGPAPVAIPGEGG